MESGPAQAVVPLVGLAPEKVIRDPDKTHHAPRVTGNHTNVVKYFPDERPARDEWCVVVPCRLFARRRHHILWIQWVHK
ncbi:MAG: hypothetical protein ACQESR_14460 [Planctomycetota bacterium]